MKILFIVIWTLICFCLAIIPETAMYFTWSLVNPVEPIAKILLVAVFWLGGAGLCFLFGVVGFALWVSGLDKLC